MWTDKIINYENKQLSNINLRFDLQFALFTIDVLKDIITFKINKDKKGKEDQLVIIKSKKELSVDQFLYWWQIIRYEDINKKELELITTYEKINKTLVTLQNSEIDKSLSEEEKQTKIIEIKMKMEKLSEYKQKEEPKLKIKLQQLNSFKNACYTKETVNKLLESIVIILQNKEETKKNNKNNKNTKE